MKNKTSKEQLRVVRLINESYHVNIPFDYLSHEETQNMINFALSEIADGNIARRSKTSVFRNAVKKLKETKEKKQK